MKSASSSSMTTKPPTLPQPASTRSSTTTFASGASLTIVKSSSATFIIRHPRTVSIRHAESTAKSLHTKLSQSLQLTHSTLHHLYKTFIIIIANLLPLLPISLHILHRNSFITILAHIPTAFFSLILLHLLTLYPHRPYLAITETELIHRQRGLLSPIRVYPLSIVRSFTYHNNNIIADTISPKITLKAPDSQTASAAVQALDTALATLSQFKPPEKLLHTPGQLIITADTPLPQFDLPPENIDIITKDDRVNVTTLPPNFPRILLVFLIFFLTHAISIILQIFIFEDLQRSLTPITPSIIIAISLAAVYLLAVVATLSWYFFNCIPKKWKLLIVGCRKDVKPGMIDIGKCRQVMLIRYNKHFGVRIVSTTGHNFLDIHSLSEGEASRLIRTLRDCFPTLFQGSV